MSQLTLAVVLVASTTLRFLGGDEGTLGKVCSVMGSVVPPVRPMVMTVRVRVYNLQGVRLVML